MCSAVSAERAGNGQLQNTRLNHGLFPIFPVGVRSHRSSHGSNLGSAMNSTSWRCERGISALDQFFQGGKECRIGDRRALAAANQRLSLGSQSRNAEGHGDTVIAERFEFSAVKSVST